MMLNIMKNKGNMMHKMHHTIPQEYLGEKAIKGISFEKYKLNMECM